jgi:hypothetical protein
MGEPASGHWGDYEPSGYDLELVSKIMRVIQTHHKDENVIPNITSLRNTMLAASALLHLIHSDAHGGSNETFVEAASAQLACVSQCAAAPHLRN